MLHYKKREDYVYNPTYAEETTTFILFWSAFFCSFFFQHNSRKICYYLKEWRKKGNDIIGMYEKPFHNAKICTVNSNNPYNIQMNYKKQQQISLK